MCVNESSLNRKENSQDKLGLGMGLGMKLTESNNSTARDLTEIMTTKNSTM